MACGSTRSCQCASTSHVLLRSASFICAVCARFVDNSVVTSLHDWSQLSCYHDGTIALAPLQRVLNAAARLVLDLKPRDHATPALRELHCATDRVQAVSARSQDIRRPHSRLHLRSAHTGRRHTNTLVAALLQQRQPLSSTDGAAIWRPCVLCCRAPCVESVADGTESHAVIDNIQVSPKDIPVQLSTLLPLTIECAIGLIVGGGAQMLLLL